MYVGGLLQLLEHGVLVEVAHVSAFHIRKGKGDLFVDNGETGLIKVFVSGFRSGRSRGGRVCFTLRFFACLTAAVIVVTAAGEDGGQQSRGKQKSAGLFP